MSGWRRRRTHINDMKAYRDTQFNSIERGRNHLHITPPYCCIAVFLLPLPYNIFKLKQQRVSNKECFFVLYTLFLHLLGKGRRNFWTKSEFYWNKLHDIVLLLRVSANYTNFILSIKMAKLHCIQCCKLNDFLHNKLLENQVYSVIMIYTTISWSIFNIFGHISPSN